MDDLQEVLELAGDLLIKNNELTMKLAELEKLTKAVEGRLFDIEMERNWK